VAEAMIASGRVRRAALGLALCAGSAPLAIAPAARAEGPTVGGSVPSVIALSLREASAFSRAVRSHRGRVFIALIPVEVTASEEPTRLSIIDGEVRAGQRRGRLVRGSSVLSVPLAAAVGHGAYRSLDVTVDPVLRRWNEPIAHAPATIRLRQEVRGRVPRTLRTYHKLLLVTITAAGP
jgi:hypothetical protein